MAKQLTDDEASLRRKARRRLIGAVALTTTVVVLLPMLLDSEPKPVGQDIELRIPDKDKVGEFAPKIGLPPEGAPAAELPAAAPAPAVPVAPAAPAVAAPPVAAPQEVAAPKAPEIKPAPAPKPANETAKVKAPEKPAPKPETKQAEKGQTTFQQGFVVQVGAFSNAETAHRWKENLVKQGIKAYTEKAGDKTRVRAGPYATREAADKVRHRLEAQGMHPDISPAQ